VTQRYVLYVVPGRVGSIAGALLEKFACKLLARKRLRWIANSQAGEQFCQSP
jgi:hypothetical protein